MNTASSFITVADIPVEIVRKNIKNLHLGVYPPEGKVRVSVPEHITDENVRLAVVDKLAWIKKQQTEFGKQPRQNKRQFVVGESHYFQGRRYLLDVVERYGRHKVVLTSNAKLTLHVRPETRVENRKRVMTEWYRTHLKSVIPTLLRKWEPIIGIRAAKWRVQKMKTKWGSCNPAKRTISLNLELAKKSPECLEYILVHELVHLHERHHNENFRQLMDKFMPKWRLYRDTLKNEPLAHEDWGY